MFLVVDAQTIVLVSTAQALINLLYCLSRSSPLLVFFSGFSLLGLSNARVTKTWVSAPVLKAPTVTEIS